MNDNNSFSSNKLITEKHYKMIEFIPEPIVIHSNEKILYANIEIAYLLGISNSQNLIGQSIRKYMHSDYYDNAIKRIKKVINDESTVPIIEIKLKDINNRIIDVEIKSTFVIFENKKSVLSIIRDITEKKRAEKIIMHKLYYDELTGIPNRRKFDEYFNESLFQAKRTGNIIGIIYIDIDNFKYINDTFGHIIGDMLLREIGLRLEQFTKNVGIVARMGGDEFALLIKDISSLKDLTIYVNNIKKVFSEYFEINNNILNVTSSIGVSIYPKDGQDIESLIKKSDIAMYYIKNKGKNDYCYYNKKIENKRNSQLRIANDMLSALNHNEFEIYYQPKIDVHNCNVIGMEALIRWNHPKHGSISPIDFIPIAEDLGLIVQIGNWVLETACRQNKLWINKSNIPLRVAINISVIQLRQKNFIETIDTILQKTGLNPCYLELEVTESSIMKDLDYNVSILKQLRKRGINISLDDFGTGYSSISYLKNLPLDNVKIDKSFIDDICIDERNNRIISLIIEMAHVLGLDVIAEGVETNEQYNFLKQIKCNCIQGYFYSKPLPSEQFFNKFIYNTKN